MFVRIPDMAISQAQNSDARQRVAPPQRNSRVMRERDNRIFAGQLFLLVCGAALACGFVYAAGQKFAAVRYGYRHEALRQEQERLLAERKKLTLELDKAVSPLRLEKAAKNAGLDVVSAAQIHASKANTVQIVKASGAQQRDTAKVNIAIKSNVAAKSSDVVKVNKTSAVFSARR
ncbi:MAG: hypothetical protein NVSMB56_06840 [Pyrinomonadaceae bacterium]